VAVYVSGELRLVKDRVVQYGQFEARYTVHTVFSKVYGGHVRSGTVWEGVRLTSGTP
jgi:hypothetical protein